MLHYDGSVYKIKTQQENSINYAINNGGILASPSSSIGDNPEFSFLSFKQIQETHYDNPTFTREL